MARKTGRRNRQQLYDRGNVACPICFAPFTRDEALAGRKITLEHVPPKSIGGQVRCLTCQQCNAGAGRDIDQAAALDRQPTKVTVDIMGKRGSFTLSDEGKPLTTPFRQFTAHDLEDLQHSRTRSFTMSLRFPDRKAVAASSLKSAYLAMFSLLGSVEGYAYVHGQALRGIRQRILLHHQHSDSGKFLIDAPDNLPDRDIFLVNQPVACWMIKIRSRTLERFVVLPSSGDSTTMQPLSDFSRHAKASTVQVVGKASWTFQTFGALRTIRMHLEGADQIDSLVGLEVDGTLPDGRRERGTCIRHIGEHATLLCKRRGT